jgi:hypothetical protein
MRALIRQPGERLIQKGLLLAQERLDATVRRDAGTLNVKGPLVGGVNRPGF